MEGHFGKEAQILYYLKSAPGAANGGKGAPRGIWPKSPQWWGRPDFLTEAKPTTGGSGANLAETPQRLGRPPLGAGGRHDSAGDDGDGDGQAMRTRPTSRAGNFLNPFGDPPPLTLIFIIFEKYHSIDWNNYSQIKKTL